VKESLRTRAFRWGFNFWPCYRGTGGRVTFIAADWREIRVRLPLNWRTRNYVGTIFGGSLCGAVDPFFMIMLIKLLGPGCTVWDKAATVRFRRPGRSTLQAVFRIPEEETAEIRRLLETETKLDRVYRATLEDDQGVVHAEVEKIIQIRKTTIKQDAQDV
jgi:acyl-coenzyme A thioesterase PaaI-like protein